ncbi:MAG: cation:proton antiporter [Candidatus Thorarchaeota archaeon]|nr:cation:proton antiporter [Candidatus Thorarchaeota archaeon]
MATGFELYIAVVFIIVGAILAKLAEEYSFPYPIPLIVLGVGLQFLFNALGLTLDVPLEFLAQLTLASVLFYAGLTMNIRETRSSIRSVMLLATLGVFLTSIIAGGTIAIFSPVGVIPLTVALLVGAILSPTDPAALFSVLESGGVRVKRKLFSILEGEAVFNDATAVILVITGFLPLVSGSSGEQNWLIVIGQFAGSMGLGVALGLGVAYGMGRLILTFGEGSNTSIFTAATPILAYGIGEVFSLLPIELHPGALAAVFAGIFMANSRRIGMAVLPKKSMRGVMKNFSLVFELAIFTFIGFTLDFAWFLVDDNIVFVGVGVLVAILVIFIARPVSVFLVTLTDAKMNMKERFFISWAGVKGVASAALGAIAIAGIADANTGNGINAIIFIVVLISLILQGITTPIIARVLNLIEEQDAAQEIASQRDATRYALLHLVDQYTEGKVDSSIYTILKSELEEEIFTLEDELRRVVSERRARLKMLEIREEIFREKLSYYQREYEQGKISDFVFEVQRQELQAEMDEIETVRRQLRSGKESDN